MYSNEMYHAALNILSTREEQLNDYDEDELYHHGILGQKWGVRRYQNEDGSLTPAGLKRYGTIGEKLSKDQKQEVKSAKKELRSLRRDAIEQQEWKAASAKFVNKNQKAYDKLRNKYGEEHEKTVRAQLVLDTSKLMDQVQSERVKQSADRYRSSTNNYVNMYGDKRIKDLKNFKTRKTGEEYIRGNSGIERGFESHYDKKTKIMKIYKTNTIYV